MLCACIDIGSTTTRLLVAEAAAGEVREVLADRAFTQLGRGLRPGDAVPAPKVDEVALFITKFGYPMGPRSIQNTVAKYATAAGITDASPHSLRHTFATHHVRKGTSLPSVRAALGHESLATTSIYVGLAREQMDKELQQNAL